VVDVKWYGSAAIELTYKDPAGKPSVVLLYRDREPTLEIGETGRPWSFDGDGKMFRLVSEAQRINLAHLFDPLLAIHTSMVDALPHQITAVYGEMLPRQPLRFLLADDPGAGPAALTRFHGSTTLNATRLSRDVDAIATSVVQHLAGLLDAKVKITLEIQADMPSGAPENVVRTVTENCRTLKFDSQGFEDD
jgi:hypothetical protein